MIGELIYAFRVMRLPLLDAGGAPIGKIDDIVVVSGRATEAPRVLGFVASSQRRRIFVSASRIGSLDNSGARLKSWDVDLNPFHPRAGERLIGKKIGVTQRGSGAEFQVIDMLADAGLTANDVTFVAVGAPDTAFPALTRGQVDLIMTFSPTDGMCEVLKACRVVVDPRKGQGPKSILATRGGAGAMAVKADWAAANAPTVAAIRKSLELSEAFVSNPANFGRTLEILRKTFALQLPNADQIAEVALRSSIGTFKARGTVPAMQAVADSMTENKLLPGKVDLAPVVLP